MPTTTGPAITGPTITDPIRKIMTEGLAEVDTEDSLTSVAEELAADEVGAVVVRTPGGPIGLISERDLIGVVADGGDLDDRQAVDVVTTDLVVAAPSDTIGDVGRLMLDAGVRHVLVKDDEALVGIVSIRDVLAVALAADR